MPLFRERRDAGRRLGQVVTARGLPDGAVILGLPRGGVPLAVEVAAAAHAPVDVLVVGKLRFPGQPELAFGAVASGGVRWLNDDVARHVAVDEVERRVDAERAAVAERERRLRPGRAPLDLTGRCAVLVDDGIATGATQQAAVEAARLLGAMSVVVAAPIATPDVVRALERVADRVDVVEVRSAFGSVSAAYDDFAQVEDDEVVALLAGHAGGRPG